jgi:hypothetical protein
MMVWVAKRREESALEMKVPMRRTHTMWPTEAGSVALDVSGLGATASSSIGSLLLRSKLDSGAETSMDESLEDRLKLLSEEGAMPGGERRGVRSVQVAILSGSREKA